MSTSAGSTRRPLPVWAALLIVVALGGLLAFQTRSNGALGAHMQDGIAAATIVFATGLVLVTVALLVSPSGRVGLARVLHEVRIGVMPKWMLLGGAVGAVFVLAQGLVGAILGTAIFTIAGVAGQTVSGLVLDRTGLGPGGRRPLTARRIGGSILGLVAVGLTVVSELGGSFPVWLLVLPLLGGLCIGWQQAVNGRVRVTAGSAVTSTFVNFLAGTVVLVVVGAVHACFSGLPKALPTEPWMYAGGITAVFFIAITSVLVRTTGVLLLGLGTIAGQLITSLGIEIAFPSHAAPMNWTTFAGTGLTLLAVLVTASGGAQNPRRETSVPPPAPRSTDSAPRTGQLSTMGER